MPPSPLTPMTRRRDSPSHRSATTRSFVRIPTTRPDDVYYLVKVAAATAAATFVGRAEQAASCFNLANLPLLPPLSDDATRASATTLALTFSFAGKHCKQPVWAPRDGRTDGRTEGRANARCAAALSLALPMPDPQSADRRTDGQRRPARRSRPITNATGGGRIHSALESPRRGRGRRLKICQLLRRLPPSCPSRHMLRWTVNSPQRSAARAHYNRIELWLPTWFPSTTDYSLTLAFSAR